MASENVRIIVTLNHRNGFLGVSAVGYLGSSRPRRSRSLLASLALHLSLAQTLIVTIFDRVRVCVEGCGVYPMKSLVCISGSGIISGKQNKWKCDRGYNQGSKMRLYLIVYVMLQFSVLACIYIYI